MLLLFYYIPFKVVSENWPKIGVNKNLLKGRKSFCPRERSSLSLRPLKSVGHVTQFMSEAVENQRN